MLMYLGWFDFSILKHIHITQCRKFLIYLYTQHQTTYKLADVFTKPSLTMFSGHGIFR